MKTSITEEIRNIFQESKTWIKLEIEYTKLTVAEKLTMLLCTLIIGFICLLLSTAVLIMLAFSLAECYKLIMNPALAYLSTAGSVCVLVVLIYVFRKPLLLNPIAHMITKIFFDHKH